MALEGLYVPDTQAEDRLMEDIHIATRRAHADGVPRIRIAALMAFMASATLDPESDAEPVENGTQRSVKEAMIDAVNQDPDGECPECGAEVDSYRAAMGGPVTLPCGCEVTITDAVEAGIMDDPTEGANG